jgi:hypothetical protein
MVPQTKQAAAIAGANALVNLMAQFQSLRQQAADLVKQYNSEQWANVWNALATAPYNADGTFGAADATPNLNHPIDTRVYANLLRAASANQYTAAVTFLNDYANFLGNVNPGAAQRSQTVDDLVS